jgi:putative membrane protein
MWWNDQHMGQWAGWGWWMSLHGILSLFLLVLLVIGVVALLRAVFGAGVRRLDGHDQSPGLKVIEERYAKGELQRDEYLQKRRDLGG